MFRIRRGVNLLGRGGSEEIVEFEMGGLGGEGVEVADEGLAGVVVHLVEGSGVGDRGQPPVEDDLFLAVGVEEDKFPQGLHVINLSLIHVVRWALRLPAQYARQGLAAPGHQVPAQEGQAEIRIEERGGQDAAQVEGKHGHLVLPGGNLQPAQLQRLRRVLPITNNRSTQEHREAEHVLQRGAHLPQAPEAAGFVLRDGEGGGVRELRVRGRAGTQGPQDQGGVDNRQDD